MLQSRRGFLIGAGSLLTAAFVTEAQAFVRQAAKPLLAEQVEAQHTLGGTGGFQRPHVQFSTELIGGDRFRRRVAASGLVALSLLQARLIELGRPIKIVEGD